MNKWTPTEIRNLRLQLGWSAAEFCRHFGCSSEVVLKWERGDLPPSPDDFLQFERLEHHRVSYSEQITRGVLAESLLRIGNLAQIRSADIKTVKLSS